MTSFLQGQLAKTLHTAMKSTVAYPVPYIQVTETGDGRTSSETTTVVSPDPRGFIAEYSDEMRSQGVRGERGMIEADDRRLFIFQQSMVGATPKKGDRATVRRETVRVVKVGQDPAQALWDLQVRPWRA